MSIEQLNREYPGWQYRPPAHLSKPFLRVGAIDFNSVGPQPALNEPQKLCDVRVGVGEYAVIHHIAVHGAVFVGGLYERLAPEAAHRMLRWDLEATQFVGEPSIATGSKDEEDQFSGIGLFGAFSLDGGSLAPIIAAPDTSVYISIVHLLAGGGTMTIPANSKLSAVMSGYLVRYRPTQEGPKPALQRTPEGDVTVPDRPRPRPAIRPPGGRS